MSAARWCVVLVVAGLCLTLAGCSSTPSYGGDGVSERLSIRILPNTSKQFIYRVGLESSREVRRVPARRGDPRRARPDPLDEGDYEQLQRRASYVVSATGYCRNGYLELDFRLSRQLRWLRGECKEGATPADRERFAGREQLPLNNLE